LRRELYTVEDEYFSDKNTIFAESIRRKVANGESKIKEVLFSCHPGYFTVPKYISRYRILVLALQKTICNDYSRRADTARR